MVPDYSSEEEDTRVPLRKTRRPKVDKVSISSSFYTLIFCTKVNSKQNSKERKDFCTKNVSIKC